jgi:hypothetical protein
LTLRSLSSLQEEILLAILNRKPVLQEELLKELKPKFPDLTIEELVRQIRELAHDWRYIYAHETSWGYRIELNSIGEREARRLSESKTRGEKALAKRGKETHEFTFFICYRQDTSSDFALHLKQGLEREGIHAFLDVVDIPKILRNSDKWWEYRDEALRNSDVFLLLITIGIEHSPEVLKEVTLARNHKKKFMYLRHSELPPDVEVNLENERVNLKDFNQISFESKEDLLRKVLQNYKEGMSKPPYYPPPKSRVPSLEKLPVPLVNFEITQKIFGNSLVRRQLPSVGFNLFNLSEYPVGIKVEAKTILAGRVLGLIQDRKGYYSGKTVWNLNPWGGIVNGNFTIPEECVDSTGELTIEVLVTIIDRDKEHELRPVSWTYLRKENDWFYEPRSFT